MLNRFGWLMLYGDIDDPATEKHGGHVYIHKDDIVDGQSLCAGDIVSFYLYSDEQGLGAEMCTVEQTAASRYSLNAAAKEFVPGSMPEIIDVDHVADVFLRLSHAFSSDSEDEDDDSDEEYYSAMPSNLKASRAPSSEGSTHGDATSDSEEETSDGDFSDSETESSSEVQWRAPPGL